MNEIIFKTKTTGGDTAVHVVYIERINNIECVHVITRLFVDSNTGNERVLRKFFNKYYIQREMLYQLSTLLAIVNAVKILKIK